MSVTRGSTGISGGNPLLAVARVVWTVTRFPRVHDVLFAFECSLVAVPTDERLTDRPRPRGPAPARADHLGDVVRAALHTGPLTSGGRARVTAPSHLWSPGRRPSSNA